MVFLFYTTLVKEYSKSTNYGVKIVLSNKIYSLDIGISLTGLVNFVFTI